MGMAIRALVLILSILRIIAGIWLVSAPLPLREGARWRTPSTFVGLAMLYALLSLEFMLPMRDAPEIYFSFGQFATYSLLLVACVGATLVVYDTNIWTALFCSSTGYTIQNLASGATELAWSLMGRGGPLVEDFNSPARIVTAFFCTAAVYLVAYLVITRRILSGGIGTVRDPSMLTMLFLVILGIIGFDLVVKWLTYHGVPVAAMVLLRLFHGLVCVFVITICFDVLVVRRLQSEHNTLGQVLAERERQYEMARNNIAAINARVHDMRHAIGRLASADGVGGEALRELVREVSVFDSAVRTGNEALDTALTEQGLRFERAGARLSCIADGPALAFMAPADTYALFSLLLGSLSPASTSLVVREALGTVSVHVEHAGPTPAATILGAVRDIVGRYQGTLTTMEQDGSSHVNVLFPAE